MREPLRNVGASVRDRLLAIARERRQSFELLLTRYVLERLLYRLSRSRHRHRFVLKGAMLLAVWFDDPLRPTRDLDLLGFGDSDPETMLAIFREICAMDATDGVAFDVTALSIDPIREEQAYGGLGIKTNAAVSGARVRVVVDIGFGDAVEPGIDDTELPVLLDFPPPHLRAYPREAVIAEKFHALVVLGRASTRLKDLYDIWALSRAYEYRSDALARAIAATFARRETTIPVVTPVVLTRAFAEDPTKQQQWAAFLEGLSMQPGPLDTIVESLAEFLMPHAAAARILPDHGG